LLFQKTIIAFLVEDDVVEEPDAEDLAGGPRFRDCRGAPGQGGLHRLDGLLLVRTQPLDRDGVLPEPLEFFRQALILDILSTKRRPRKRKYFIIEPNRTEMLRQSIRICVLNASSSLTSRTSLSILKLKEIGFKIPLAPFVKGGQEGIEAEGCSQGVTKGFVIVFASSFRLVLSRKPAAPAFAGQALKPGCRIKSGMT
jgi:hypothetical protein